MIKNNLLDNEEIIAKLVRIFLEDTPTRIASLKEALERGDRTTATHQTHSIKGAAAIVGAERLREVALSMERACRSNNSIEEVKSMFPSLERKFEEFGQFAETRFGTKGG